MRKPAESLRALVPVTLRFAALAVAAISVAVLASPLAGGVVLALGLGVLISYEATRASGSPRRS
jgi:hypothetical protein